MASKSFMVSMEPEYECIIINGGIDSAPSLLLDFRKSTKYPEACTRCTDMGRLRLAAMWNCCSNTPF